MQQRRGDSSGNTGVRISALRDMSEGQGFLPLFGGMTVFLMGFVIIAIAVGILQIIATWKLYRKAGEKGWAAIVPFYNLYVMVKIAWGNGWLFLLYLVPMGNIVFAIGTCVKLARAFGKGGGYAVGLIFLPYVFLSILGFGQAEYQGTDKFISKGIIIATAVTGGGVYPVYGRGKRVGIRSRIYIWPV